MIPKPQMTPEQKQQTVDTLIDELRKVLEGKGIPVRVEHDAGDAAAVLSAALEYLNPVANSLRGRPKRDDLIYLEAGAWDQQPNVQKLCNRSAWVSNALRDAGLAVLTNAEAKAVETDDPAVKTPSSDKRKRLIEEAVKAYDALSPEDQRRISRKSFVNVELLEQNLDVVTEGEVKAFGLS